MLYKLIKTSNSWEPLLLRVLLGMVIFPHGAQKLFGWFGGYGFAGSMGYFTDAVGIPWILGLMIILLETLGAVLLMAGLATRLLAILYTLLAVGIVTTTHFQNGFFMNWFGNQAGEGYEYFLLWLGISLALAVSGGGMLSADKAIGGHLNSQKLPL